MKTVTVLKEFFYGDKTQAVGDTIEVDNASAAAWVNQGLAEYAGGKPEIDVMKVAHLEPETEPLPPVFADPPPKPDVPEPHKTKAEHKAEAHKGHH